MNIREIAKLSGYGVGTVSRVINKQANVSNKARDHILAIIKEKGFEPNTNARLLKIQAPSAVVIFVKGAHNMFFADLLEKIQNRLEDASEDARVVYLTENENEVKAACSYCKQWRPKGIIFLGGDIYAFQQGFGDIKVPAVLLTSNASTLGFTNLSSFSTDDIKAAQDAIEALVQAGHRRIALLGGNRSFGQISELRVQGALAALQAHGISFDVKTDWEPSSYTLEGGYRAAQTLIKKAPDKTAIFALGDLVAIGAMRAFADMGIRVPQDISLIGCDGLELADYMHPRLMTIEQNSDLLAELGVDTLLDALYAHMECGIHQTVSHRLRLGESVISVSECTACKEA